jgi:hypothetical protein
LTLIREQSNVIANCGEIYKKDGIEFLRISVNEFHGRKYIDMRRHFEKSNGDIIRDIGFTIQSSSVDEVIYALRNARSVLAGEGEPF